MPVQDKRPFVIVTGDGEGLGNAVLHFLLKQDRRVRVIGMSRRPMQRVEGFEQLTPEARERFTHLEVDFMVPDQAKATALDARRIIREGGGELVSLVLVNGTGYLDTDVQRDPSLFERMDVLNRTAPMALVREFIEEMPANAAVFYFSGIVTHPSIQDPLLKAHAEIKKAAVAELNVQLGTRLKVVMPGAYRTAMLESNIVRHDSLLEWYAVPLADPHANRGLASLVARYALAADATRVPTAIIRPRLSKWLVSSHTAAQLTKTLPGAIKRAARTVLAETRQTDADHDRRIEFFKQNKLYGDQFPYDQLTSKHLWPAWLSKLYSATLRSLHLLH